MSTQVLDPFETATLRELDAASRERIEAVARRRAVSVGDTIYEQGEDADGLFVVLRGRVRMEAIRRGEVDPVPVRIADPGHSFGQEASLGLPRRSRAVAHEDTVVFEAPAALVERAIGRSGGQRAAEVERRRLMRAVTEDLLRTMALTQDLAREHFDAVLDAAVIEHVARDRSIFIEGDRADAAFLVVDGLVALQREGLEGTAVLGYLQAGDLFGEDDVVERSPRTCAAVSLGKSMLLRIPAALLMRLFSHDRGLHARVRRVAARREGTQQAVVGAAAAQATRHAFVDLHRMQMARSLLVIDQSSCVRCGHCAWSCAHTHDDRVARLVRRGDTISARVEQLAEGPKPLLIPSACQHCRNPACMVDCPTAAITRDGDGDVEIDAKACTGCGACAKACPWDNIAIAPRPASLRPSPFDAVAVKCDLCKGHDGPACVQACPTGALLRVEPERDLVDIGALLGTAESKAPSAPARPRWGGVFASSLALALAGAAWIASAQTSWVPGAGAGLLAGWGAAVAMLASAGYGVFKRVPSLWHRARGRRSKAPRSRMRPAMLLHAVLGVFAATLAWTHTGGHAQGTSAVFAVVFIVCCALGVWGALLYAIGPKVLARIESGAGLPEDLNDADAERIDALMQDLSGRSEALKQLVQRVLLPYARRPLGAIGWVLSGRTRREERRRLHDRIVAMVGPERAARMEGLNDVLRTVVALRAVGTQRRLHRALRAWLVPHIFVSIATLALLGVHVATRWGAVP